jgi:riboflavin kinase/FMN adenylyltransferase
MITIGSFDGVHIGHQALIETAIREAKKRKLRCEAITFRLPPKFILDPTQRPQVLSDADEKVVLLRTMGIEGVSVLEFNQQLSTMRPFLFFRDVLIRQYKARGVVVGLDFRFGADRSAGAVELVRWGGEFGIPVWVIPPVKWRRKVVSSTLIRKLIGARFESALGFIGHPYLIRGPVVTGEGMGRKLGFPTANIQTSPQKVLPLGVYVVRGWIDTGGPRPVAKRIFHGVCNIGYRPTVSTGGQPLVEVHIFDRHQNFVGKTMCVELLKRLRKEKKFPSLDALKSQIRKDAAQARRYFGSGAGRPSKTA